MAEYGAVTKADLEEAQVMDNQTCDKHPSAQAKARVTLPSGGVLYVCGHCSETLDFGADFWIEYESPLTV